MEIALKTETKRAFKRVQGKVKRFRTYARHTVPSAVVCLHTNLFHCSTQKTASQWIRRIFQNIYAYTGLDEYALKELPERIQDIRIDKPFPRWTVVTQLYIGYTTYRDMPKPDSYRTFYVLRDLRDIVASEYFSLLYSHSLIAGIGHHRQTLSELSQSEGLIYTINYLRDFGLFDVQRSWIDQCDDPNVKFFHYEDLTNDEELFLIHLFQHCDIVVPRTKVQHLIQSHGFKAMTGREQGQENIKDHYRKGIARDWEHYFDDQCLEHFHQVTGDLVTTLGYH
jgi:hypothetical protein